jgi:hypothetical protein
MVRSAQLGLAHLTAAATDYTLFVVPAGHLYVAKTIVLSSDAAQSIKVRVQPGSAGYQFVVASVVHGAALATEIIQCFMCFAPGDKVTCTTTATGNSVVMLTGADLIL